MHAVLDHDLTLAERILGDAVRRDSNEVDGYLALAQIFRQRGEIGRAIHMHQNLLLRRDLAPPLRHAALRGLAEDFRNGGFLRRAIAAYEELLARNPRDPSTLRALVKLFVDAREPRRAVPLARRLVRVAGQTERGTEAGVWIALAEVERSEGHTEAAKKSLRRALRVEPKALAAWRALGEVEAELGRNRDALAAWRRVPELDRRAGPALYPRLAATFAALDRARDYETWLRELVAADPEDPGARLALAEALAARGSAEEALAETHDVLETQPKHIGAHVARGRILLSSGRLAEVGKAHEALLDLLERESVTVPVRAAESLG